MSATPIKNETPGQFSESGFLTWNGEPIPCLNICRGDLLNKVVYIIASKLCEVLEPYDLSTLTLQGVLDILDTDETGTRSLTSVLQLLIDGEIAIDTRLVSLQNQVDGISTRVLVLDLKCFREVDNFGNSLPYTEQTVLQGLINEACLNKDLVATLSGKVTDLQNQIDDLDIQAYTEPIISTCISTNKSVSQAVKEHASNYCGFKESVGDELKIQQNISKLSAGTNKNYVGEDGWNVAPTNLSDYVGNLTVVIEDLINRLTTIEDNCCKVTCKDFGIGFEIIPSSDGLSISLRFSEKSGTDIPGAFTDKGSVLVLTDKNDTTLSYNVIVSQDGISGPFSLAGLDTSDVLNVALTAKVGSDTLQCEKCLSKLFSPVQGCPVCEVIGTGSTGNVVIIYRVSVIGPTKLTSYVFNSITVIPGTRMYIPKDAEVVAINKTGNANISSDCLDLTNVEDFACYSFNYSIGNAGSGPTGVLEDDEVTATGIEILGTMYPLDRNNLQNQDLLADAIKAVIPSGIILITNTIEDPGTSDRQDQRILFKTTPTIAASMKLKFSGTGYPNFYITPESSDECSDTIVLS